MSRVLFLTAYPIEDASCRYRVHQFVPYLTAAGYECTVSTFATNRLFRILKSRGHLTRKLAETLYCALRRALRLLDIGNFDVIVIHREAFPFLTPWVENWVLRRHPHVIFSFDDAIYAGHENAAQLSHPLLYRWKHGKGYDDVIQRCERVIAGNRVLAEYAEQLNPNVSVMPTVVDCEQYRYTEKCDTEPVTIGWMGSRSTVLYLNLVEPALRRIALSYPGKVRFRFVGCPDYTPHLNDCESLYFDLTREMDDLRTFDIGLMPLADSEWARGKCAFKAIQYMASGAATIASPFGITSDLIQHEVNGLLAGTAEEWFRALDRLVRDAGFRHRLAANARRTIERSYSLQVWGPRFVALFDQLCTIPEALPSEASAA